MLSFAVDNFMQRTESLPPNISVEQTQWEFWKFSVPWKAILQSKSVWSVLICHFVYDWGWFTLVTCMPTYLSRVLGFNILSNSFLSSIPYIVQIVVSLTVAFLSDIFIVHKLLSTTWIRRVNNFIALAGLGIGIISVGLVGCNAYVAVGIFSVTVGLMGFSAAGFFSNTLDIAAPYAGNISSIASTFASVSGIFAPLIVGFVTKDNSNLTNWFIIFGVSSGLAWLGAFINLYLTSGEVEPWASLPSS
ncbi:unnamed protein product [Heterobilharzia americana]|nr:unnamed protein product [Heterobilharzia americana]